MIGIEIEELVALKEQGMSDGQIAQYFTKQGIEMKTNTVAQSLYRYYKSKGKEKPRIYVSNEKLIKLKEQGMTDNEIAEELVKQGINISAVAVRLRLKEYYEAQSKEKTEEERKVEISIEELVKLKEKGMSDSEIAENFTRQGRKISEGYVGARLRHYYKAKGKEKPRTVRKSNLNLTNTDEKNEKYDNPIKQMLMSGMTIYEFFPNEEELEDAKTALEKLRIISLYSKKENGEIVPDYDFATVISYASGIRKISQLEPLVKPWIQGNIKKGRITFIKENFFGSNVDLMTYILKRLKLKNDGREFRIYREQYEGKIDKYLERLRLVEEGRRKTKGNSEITSSDTTQGDER